MTPLAYADWIGHSKRTVYRWIETETMPRGKAKVDQWGAAWERYPNGKYVIFIDTDIHPSAPLYTSDSATVST